MYHGNIARQYQASLIWDGTTSFPVDLRTHINFAIAFDIPAVSPTTDAIFNLQWAPPSAADPCVPDTTWTPVAEVLTCVSDWGAVGAAQAQITVPANTPIGSKCSASIPCKPGAFLRIVPGSGNTANVRAMALLGGPH